MKYLLQILIILFSTNILCQENITIGKRYKLESNILNESRYINVYLPHSYHSTTHTAYPVIYLMDGDYNFHYVSGLIEQMSVISEKIPEMIVIGLADKGHQTYVKDCTPYDEENNPNGNSANYLNHILEEVKPYINSEFRTADYDILIGQSLGGLFVINALLNNYESFDNYIAISPSLWWNDYETENKLEQFFNDNDSINKKLYLSLGNEKGMGVLGFQNQLDINVFADEYYKNEPIGLDYMFNYYVDENHNSVGLISIKNALSDMFSSYEIPDKALKEMDNFDDYKKSMEEINLMIGDGFRFPKRQFREILKIVFEIDRESLDDIENDIKNNYLASLGDYYSIIGDLYLRNSNIERAEDYLIKSCTVSPNSIENVVSLADLYVKKENFKKAKDLYKKSIEMAREQNTNYWYLNQLESNLINLI